MSQNNTDAFDKLFATAFNAHMEYQSGFGNYFESEAVKNILPRGQNNPQKTAQGLYAEQLNGSAFTAPRNSNLRSWLYKVHPSVADGRYTSLSSTNLKTAPFSIFEPNQLRWKPFPYAHQKINFLESLTTFTGNGSPQSQTGCAVHLYSCNTSMENTYFYSADGDFLFVPQEGELTLRTEFGALSVKPTEIAVIPKGVKFQVNIKSPNARGYVCENYGAPFILPDLGPIGANGLANPRDFLAPVAAYDEKSGHSILISKFMGQMFEQKLKHSPLDVVAWHGNYYPYKYDLSKFNTINTVSFDHPDPSIFTVLTSPSATHGTANIDFVIFPPRWMVAEHTFRPPYYHRNTMSEFMGLITGVYDAKSDEFAPGGCSLHNAFSGHGPDKQTFDKASSAALKPEKIENTMAFMFESRYPFGLTEWSANSPLLDKSYQDCWVGL